MQSYTSNMESDYPDLYSQYSKIHSNNVEMDSNSDNVHYQTNDTKPVGDQTDVRDNFGEISVKSDRVDEKSSDITEELSRRYENDVSGTLSLDSQLSLDVAESKQQDDLKEDSHKNNAVMDGNLVENKINNISDTKDDGSQSVDIPAPSPQPVEKRSQGKVKDEEAQAVQPCKTETEVKNEEKDKEVCRICMEHGVLISIFNSDSVLSVSEKVMSCAAVQISLDDGLPGFICELCESDLEIAYKFKKRCEESDVALRAKLGLKPKTVVKTEFVLIDCDNEPIVSDDNKRVSDSESDEESDDPPYGSKRRRRKSKKNKVKKASKPRKCKEEKNKAVKLKEKTKKLKEEIKSERSALKRKAAKKNESDDDVIVVSKNQPPPKIRKTEPPVGRYPCTFCEKSFPYPSVLKLHMVTHTKEKTHKCSICTMAFMYSKDLYAHYKDAHPNEYGKVDESGKYSCSTCKKPFALLKQLKVHEAMHVKEKKYKCELCTQMFTNMTSLNLHVKLDHPENSKPYKCKVCDKRFKQQVTMEKHMENHRNSRPVEKIEEKRPTSTKDLFKSIAPLTTTYWSDSFSD